MRSGALRHPITVQTLTATPDDMGGETRSWGTHVTSWAEIVPAGAKERWFGDQIEANISHRVTMRFQSGITPKMRVLFESRVFQIRGVVNRDERSIYLDLMCEEGPAS